MLRVNSSDACPPEQRATEAVAGLEQRLRWHQQGSEPRVHVRSEQGDPLASTASQAGLDGHHGHNEVRVRARHRDSDRSRQRGYVKHESDRQETSHDAEHELFESVGWQRRVE